MTFWSLIRVFPQKVLSIPRLPNAKQNMATRSPSANDTPPVLQPHHRLAVSKALFAHGSRTHDKMPRGPQDVAIAGRHASIA